MTGRYVLMTPARNEAAFIERTLLSVVNQDLTPQKWVIVDDNSHDDTTTIVADYARRHRFIELVTADGDRARNFGSKAKALEEAYGRLVDLDFEFVGNLDADVSFGTAYYAEMLAHFDADPRLGIVGGIQYDWIDGRWQLLHQSSNSVAGPFQLFRRRCWEEVGGYRVLPYGGVDATAEVTARQLGWRVRSNPDQVVYHHRATGTAVDGYYRARFRAGQRDFTLGYHPLFLLFRVGAELVRGSVREFVGGIAFLSGYLWAQLRRPPSGMPGPVKRFLRAEQLHRLKTMVRERRDPVPRHRSLPATIAPAPYGQG